MSLSNHSPFPLLVISAAERFYLLSIAEKELVEIWIRTYNQSAHRAFVPVAQLDRALASGARGCAFESHRGYSVTLWPLGIYAWRPFLYFGFRKAVKGRLNQATMGASKPANAPIGSEGPYSQKPGPESQCEPYRKVGRLARESIRISEMSTDLRAATTVSADLPNAWERIGRYRFPGWNVCPVRRHRSISVPAPPCQARWQT